MTYKWRIADVDAIEMPMLFCLLDEIGEQPPYDLMANAQARAAERKEEVDAKGSLKSLGAVKGKVRRRPDGY